jgi:hypothetical protein
MVKPNFPLNGFIFCIHISLSLGKSNIRLETERSLQGF